MKDIIPIAALLLSACGSATEPSNPINATSIVSVSLPDEPRVPWTGESGALIARNCLACHSPEMIANQPPLGADKWQATVDKMRTVYGATIAKSDDAALVSALREIQTAADR